MPNFLIFLDAVRPTKVGGSFLDGRRYVVNFGRLILDDMQFLVESLGALKVSIEPFGVYVKPT